METIEDFTGSPQPSAILYFLELLTYEIDSRSVTYEEWFRYQELIKNRKQLLDEL